MVRTLDMLAPGERAAVAHVGAGEAKLRQRLVDMGITPMTEITVTKVAPLGDPIEIRLRGYSLSIRREDAARIRLLDEEERARRLAAERRLEEKRASALPGAGHHANADVAAHKGAARLSQWYVSEQAGCPSGGCAACAGCGFPKKRKPMPADIGGGTPIKLALVGNPNSGKTTLFNALTGAKEYVGNWPGVTVEKKERRLHACGHEMTVVDLPGIYSLSAYSMEELVARRFVLDEKPDAIINIIDATNLERNLYLTVQLMELETPMILALNMMDEVEKLGVKIDVTRLSYELGVPVAPICARTGQGVDALLERSCSLLSLAHAEIDRGFSIEPDDLYDDVTHGAHHRIGAIIGDAPARACLPAHWCEIKLLEDDPLVRDALRLSLQQQKQLERLRAEYAGEGSLSDAAMRVADSRYRYIGRAVAESLKRETRTGKTATERIDAVLTNKYAGIPIFLAIMGLIFLLTFDTVGLWLSDGASYLIEELLAPWASGLLIRAAAPAWLVGLLVDGVITGVGGVVTFLPQIALLFFFLSLLEDSGYMARTAFLMDGALKRFGLSGKSFIPMLMGFGCTVPAALCARTMENEQDRRMTILLLPFVSCSAKLPVYGMVASVFFARARGLVVLSLYAMGIVVGIATGVLFKKTLFAKNHAAFIMELPPYRLPALKNTLTHVGERVGHFLQKAGSILLVMSVVLWFLTRFDAHFAMTDNPAQSLLGIFGTWIAPIFKPLGFGRWEASVALLTGLVAKEAVVSSLSLFIGGTGEALNAALATLFTPLSAYSFLVFVLLYVPCLAAVATMRRELGSGKYTAFMIAYQLMTAYLMSLLVYTIGRFLLR